ncbi:MAG: CDP-diacylglycerol--serine O-phosphatidyltransferase, partial [Ruminococcaceae bacterium]|nr:CDP-diacylglycerol--serine O-phosphatidyltransferase [Oscillospiraceae bacterium]
MLGFYNYTVILTYLSLISGTIGIFAVATGKPLVMSIICLLLSGFFDLFDGKVARTRKQSTDDEKRFGIQLDSLADLVCFGVLPAVMGVSYGLNNYFYFTVMALYVLAGLIRLAYFNVSEENRSTKEGGVRSQYDGLPITSAAIIFPLFYCFKICANDYFDAETFSYLYCGLLIAVGFAFLFNRIKIRKAKGTMIYIIGLFGLVELVTVLIVYILKTKNI